MNVDDDPKRANDVGPLVVAFIGTDDPYRGDSKGAIGVARKVAKLLNGSYQYVDEASLSAKFNHHGGYHDQIKAFVDEMGEPNVVIGTRAQELVRPLSHRNVLLETHYNESYSSFRSNGQRGLVSHDLTAEMLNEAGDEFSRRNPDIKGDLVAVFIGGLASLNDGFADILLSKAKFHDELTFYICPSGRSGRNFNRLKSYLLEKSANLGTKIHVLGEDFDTQIANYNPYHGLLAKADYNVMLGDSGSMISEALFTEKPLYLNAYDFTLNNLVDSGRLLPLNEERDKPFLKKKMPRLNVTDEVAASIAEEYIRDVAYRRRVVRKSSENRAMLGKYL